MPPSPRRRARSLYDNAALGTYRGPTRATVPPKATPYRITLLRAIDAGEVKAGQGQYVNAWRWHGATSVTCTKWIREFFACGWVRIVGAHLELTPAGVEALETAQRKDERMRQYDPETHFLMTQSEWDEHERIRDALGAEVNRLDAELDKARCERDLAIAHDRQPYPTADAYDAACAALEKHRARADALAAALNRRQAELELVRPVVEAAKAWAAEVKTNFPAARRNTWLREDTLALVAAVDAYDATGKGETDPGHHCEQCGHPIEWREDIDWWVHMDAANDTHMPPNTRPDGLVAVDRLGDMGQRPGFGRRNVHCSNCGDERGGPFGHETSECKYRHGMTAGQVAEIVAEQRRDEFWDQCIDRHIAAELGDGGQAEGS